MSADLKGSARAGRTGSAGVSPASSARSSYGWHTRGYLPHFDRPGLVQFVTIRLADALSSQLLEQLSHELRGENHPERRRLMESYLDSGHGECLLEDPQLARLVEAALMGFDGARYHLLAWVVMPNHVHVLVETVSGHPISNVVHSSAMSGCSGPAKEQPPTYPPVDGGTIRPSPSTGRAREGLFDRWSNRFALRYWKSFTAKQACRFLGRSGRVWQPEYFDRAIRDERHLAAAVAYIHDNPVKAGLAQTARDWPYSSAAVRAPTTGAGETPALPGRPGGDCLR